MVTVPPYLSFRCWAEKENLCRGYVGQADTDVNLISRWSNNPTKGVDGIQQQRQLLPQRQRQTQQPFYRLNQAAVGSIHYLLSRFCNELPFTRRIHFDGVIY